MKTMLLNKLKLTTAMLLIDLTSAVPPRVFAPPEDGGDLIWSGDGSRLIIVYSKRGHGKDQRHTSTFWMDSDGSNRMRLFIPDPDSVVDWSRDGKVVVTVADRNRSGFGYQLYVMRPDGVGASKPQLVVVDADGRNARPLPLPKTGWLGRPVWP
jgi:Tol biopolymer transport system component